MPDAANMHSLLERFQRQDRAAFAELFQMYHLRVFRSAYLIAHHREAADDITQLVFIELFSALRRFDLSRSFLPWLYRVTHNVSVDYLKRNRRSGDTVPVSDAHLDALLGPDPGPGSADHTEQAELRRAIWQAMERLSVDQRSVLVLCYYADLHEQEMANALGVRPGTIKSRLHRARQALREELTRDHRFVPPEYTRGVQVTEPAPGAGE